MSNPFTCNSATNTREASVILHSEDSLEQPTKIEESLIYCEVAQGQMAYMHAILTELQLGLFFFLRRHDLISYQIVGRLILFFGFLLILFGLFPYNLSPLSLFYILFSFFHFFFILKFRDPLIGTFGEERSTYSTMTVSTKGEIDITSAAAYSSIRVCNSL